MTDTLTHFIGGEAQAGDATGESINPSNLDDVVARYPKAKPEDVDRAVKAAREAFPGWSEASPEIRSDVLDRAGNLPFGLCYVCHVPGPYCSSLAWPSVRLAAMRSLRAAMSCGSLKSAFS